VTDAVYILNYNFLGGTAPPGPFPGCGKSTLESDRSLGCATPTPAGPAREPVLSVGAPVRMPGKVSVRVPVKLPVRVW